MKGNAHTAPWALPPLVRVKHGVVPGAKLTVVVSAVVVVSQAVPIERYQQVDIIFSFHVISLN